MLNRQNYNQTEGTVTAILIYNREFWNSLIKKIFTLPTVIAGRNSCLYILFDETHKKLEEFVQTAEAGAKEFHVFSKEQEQSMMSAWIKLGFMVS
jgi:hypothetical protein